MNLPQSEYWKMGRGFPHYSMGTLSCEPSLVLMSVQPGHWSANGCLNAGITGTAEESADKPRFGVHKPVLRPQVR